MENDENLMYSDANAEKKINSDFVKMIIDFREKEKKIKNTGSNNSSNKEKSNSNSSSGENKEKSETIDKNKINPESKIII